ncbi:MAG: hypothetical protein ABL994_16905, partial [Verrucomicrobiales bacterium]
METTAQTFRATADYQVTDRNPLVLEEGDFVRMGRPDPGWPGWVWVSAIDGRGSHVPEDILVPFEDGTARVDRSFHARDLSVVREETVESLREVKGWHWCRNDRGDEGWLPA